jgi:outer membrane beta-barrel protein
MTRLLKTILPVLLATATATSAFAERRDPLAGQPAIRNKREMRKLRFEITPQFLTSTNQDYRHSFGPGANLQFHITDWIGIGVSGSYHFNSNTPLEDKVREQLPTGNYTYPGPQPTLAIHDQHVLSLNALAAVYASLTPWSGKFALFSAAFARYDFFVNLGLGLINYTQNCCEPGKIASPRHPVPGTAETLSDPNLEDPRIFAGLKVGGMVGVGVHIFFTDWVGLQLELRDYFTKANPGGLDTNGDRTLTTDDETLQNHIFFGFGVTFLLPPKAKISQ